MLISEKLKNYPFPKKKSLVRLTPEAAAAAAHQDSVVKNSVVELYPKEVPLLIRFVSLWSHLMMGAEGRVTKQKVAMRKKMVYAYNWRKKLKLKFIFVLAFFISFYCIPKNGSMKKASCN